MAEPIWLTREIVEIIHAEQLAEHGGAAGVRDDSALESALARPRQRFTFQPDAPLPRLAASLCFGLARNHPFVDGNKRTALLATYVFLALNGRTLDAPETEVAETIEALAAGTIDEERLAEWVGAHARPR
jgi:death-on-curing protein